MTANVSAMIYGDMEPYHGCPEVRGSNEFPHFREFFSSKMFSSQKSPAAPVLKERQAYFLCHVMRRKSSEHLVTTGNIKVKSSRIRIKQSLMV